MKARETDRHRGTGVQTDIGTDRQIDRKTDRHTSRWTDGRNAGMKIK